MAVSVSAIMNEWRINAGAGWRDDAAAAVLRPDLAGEDIIEKKTCKNDYGNAAAGPCVTRMPNRENGKKKHAKYHTIRIYMSICACVCKVHYTQQ